MAEKDALKVLESTLAGRGIDIKAVKEALKGQAIETPSWAYANSGTRFHTFGQAGAARNILEKLEDASCVHKLTGVCPTVAVHVLWDFVDKTVAEAKACAESLGVKIGAINPTLFEQSEYKFGSIGSPDARARQKALDHLLYSVDIMRECDSKFLSIWLADGTNYPGQDDLRQRKHRVAENLQKVHGALDDDMQMLVEYKFFEPAFYSTDIGDWGMAYLFCKKCGPKAKVLVDLGHHPLGTNIEQIVALLIDEDMLGGFHFNSKKYADDDLTVASVQPYEFFLIFNELVAAAGGGSAYDVPYMIDQSHNLKGKIEAMIQSVMNIQETYAKALCLDRKALAAAQQKMDIIAAESVMKDAFFTDVRPLLGAVREEMGLAPDPLAAYRESGYQGKIEKSRS
ncbi:MAG: L-rhamnose isomerase [Sedimentisphaerales bacterium]|nr:L-rhamnose isomerase [Sedimentisphaerales bacterium]